MQCIPKVQLVTDMEPVHQFITLVVPIYCSYRPRPPALAADTEPAHQFTTLVVPTYYSYRPRPPALAADAEPVHQFMTLAVFTVGVENWWAGWDRQACCVFG